MKEFSLREFIMGTLADMVGNRPEFQIKEIGLNWYSRGVLTEDDLAQIEEWFAPEEEAAEPTEPSEEETAAEPDPAE